MHCQPHGHFSHPHQHPQEERVGHLLQVDGVAVKSRDALPHPNCAMPPVEGIFQFDARFTAHLHGGVDHFTPAGPHVHCSAPRGDQIQGVLPREMIDEAD